MKTLVKVGIFYDGHYFAHVSNYYNYIHPKKTRLSLTGLHEFIRRTIASYEEIDPCYVQIIDSQYFKGRFLALESFKSNKLMAERQFDDILMSSGITTHYFPITQKEENSIEISLSLEALELTFYKKFDIVVLLVSSLEYLPLVKKLNARGTRVMILSWEYQYVDPLGRTMTAYTPQQLLNEASYPVDMHSIIEEKLRTNDSLINTLFVKKNPFAKKYTEIPRNEDMEQVQKPEKLSDFPYRGSIQTLKEGYGFIKPEDEIDGNNIFFYYGELDNADFNEIEVGDSVEFYLGKNNHGYCALNIKVLKDFSYND